MKKLLCILLIALLIVTLTGCKSNKNDLNQTALSYIEDFVAGNYETMITNYQYTPQMKSAITKELLAKVWQESLVNLCGEFVSLDKDNITSETVSGVTNYKFNLNFKEQQVIIQVGLNNANQIANFLLSGYKAYEEKTVPSGVVRKEVTFGLAPYTINGTLTYKDNTPIDKCLIIVAGSGPNDRNLTLYGNSPYYDISIALAQMGIAVLTYDKRTFTYGKEMANKEYTVYDEVIDDTVYAYEYLKNEENISNVYIAGHSLGGYLLPRIYTATKGQANGYIFIAAPSSSMPDAMMYQFNYLFNYDGEVTESEKMLLTQYTAIIDNIKNLTEENKSKFNSSVLFNVSASYWLDLQNYDPVSEAKNMTKPMLFINGSTDYQVPLSEFEVYKNNVVNAKFVVLENINHILLYEETLGNGTNYIKISTVPESVINVLYDFIMEN